MPAEKSYTSIRNLVESLSTAVACMEEGILDRNDLEEMTENSRELFERLVVLRHFAYQKEVKRDADLLPAMEIPFSLDAQEPIDLPAKDDSYLDNDEPTADEIPETSLAAQTSLIDAIEELSDGEDEKTLVDKFVDQQSVVSLADKLVKAPIEDLAKAITLNQKFIFISELFGESEQYEKAILSLNSCSDFDSAMDVLRKWMELESWTNGDSAEEFKELVQRRFLNSAKS